MPPSNKGGRGLDPQNKDRIKKVTISLTMRSRLTECSDSNDTTYTDSTVDTTSTNSQEISNIHDKNTTDDDDADELPNFTIAYQEQEPCRRRWNDDRHIQRIILRLDRLHTMKDLEKSMYRCQDYMLDAKRSTTKSSSSRSNRPVDESCRFKISEWCYKVIDFFDLSRETAYLAVNYLDRFMQSHNQQQYHRIQYPMVVNPSTQEQMAEIQVNRSTYKLAATTALLLAIKIQQPKKVDLTKVVKELSRGEFDGKDVAEMEMIMLKKLCWRLHPPTPESFVLRILALDPLFESISSLTSPMENGLGVFVGIQEFDAEGVQDLSLFFSELAVYDYFFVTQKQSTIALAAIMNAMESHGLFRSLKWYKRSYMGCRKSYRQMGIMSRSIMDFVHMIFDVLGVNQDSLVLLECRNRLWELYQQSKEYENRREVEEEEWEQIRDCEEEQEGSRKSQKYHKDAKSNFESIQRTNTSSKRWKVAMGKIASPKSVV